jgi:hypothetical protein
MVLHAVHSRYGMDGIPGVSDTIFFGRGAVDDGDQVIQGLVWGSRVG